MSNASTNPFARRGILFVLSAPSGAGKTTLCNALRCAPDFFYSVSCTTRAARPGELDGKDYHFLSKQDFETKISHGQFLEHACVHGNYYGTLRESIVEKLQAGHDVLLDIDVQGAAMVRQNADATLRADLVDVFIMPPSLEELRRRLLKRGTESEEQLALRMANAEQEMQSWNQYAYTIVTGTPEEDLLNFRAIMRAERAASRRLRLKP